jgi:hypothetical protein
VDSTTRKLSGQMRGTVLTQGRPAPPAPPPGPISRVAASLYMRQPPPSPQQIGPRIPFGLPNLRRNVCPHFYVTGPRGPVSIQAPHLLKALMRQDANISRCQVRGGIHLEQSYVSDICLSSRFNQCVFYEDELTSR